MARSVEVPLSDPRRGRLSATSFREMIDFLDPVFVMACVRDDDGRIVDFRYEYLNSAAISLLDEPEGSMVGKRMLDLYPSHFDPVIFDAHCRVVETGEPYVSELPWFDGRNMKGFFEVTRTRFGDGYLACARDITARKRAEEQVRGRDGHLQATLDSQLDPHVLLEAVRDESGRTVDFIYTYTNDAACHYNQLPRDELIGVRLLDLFPGHSGTGLLAMYADVVDSGQPLVLDDYAYPNEILDSERRYDIRAVRVGDALSYTWRDVTDRHAATEALAASKEALRVVLDNSLDGILRFDTDLRIEFVNRRIVERSGIPAEAWIGKTLGEMGYPDHLNKLWDARVRQVLTTGEPVVYQFELDTADGHRWHEASLAPELAPDGSVAHVISSGRDVTERHLTEDRLQVLATHDPLTGLANRAALLDEITRALRVDRRSGHSTAVLMVDLDHFKYINDSLGHAVGDDILLAAARRIEASVRGGDLVARPGGDEFVIVMRDLNDPTEAARGAQRVVDSFRSPFSAKDTELYATASVGVAVSSASSDADDLVREADTAMYVAKDDGRDRVSLFNEELRAAVTSRLSIESNLRHALERSELAVWYQPEIDLATESVIAVEALLRWHHPDGTLYTADRFIDIAEETGLILDIGDWVLQEACAQAAAWATARPDHSMSVRVNLSALQLADAGLLDALDRALAASQLDPSLLCVEITETTLLRETSTVHRNLAGIGDRGIRVAVDDFGTGYASLAYLRDYHVDVLKIDRSFITNITTDEHGRELVAAIVALAHRLRMTVTAEGVEHQAQADLLRTLGCDSAQGFLYSKAVPSRDIDSQLDFTFAHSRPPAGRATSR